MRTFELEFLDLANIAASGLEPDFQRAILFGDTEPIGLSGTRIEIPTPNERRRSFLGERQQEADKACR
jgi:hypothetical protein